LILENRYDVPAPVLVNPPEAVSGNPVPAVMLVPKIKFPEALILAVPPIVVVPAINVLIEVMLKRFGADNENASKMLTLPPKIVTDPARLKALLNKIFPVFPVAPIVSPLPDALDEMGSLTFTANEVEFPCIDNELEARWLSITEAAIVAVPVTVKLLPVMPQLVPEVPVCPDEEMVKF
jgi:hypothetical protein